MKSYNKYKKEYEKEKETMKSLDTLDKKISTGESI